MILWYALCQWISSEYYFVNNFQHSKLCAISQDDAVRWGKPWQNMRIASKKPYSKLELEEIDQNLIKINIRVVKNVLGYIDPINWPNNKNVCTTIPY